MHTIFWKNIQPLLNAYYFPSFCASLYTWRNP